MIVFIEAHVRSSGLFIFRKAYRKWLLRYSLFAVCDHNWRHLPTDFIHKFLVFTVVLALVGVLWLWILWRAVFFIETAENWI